MLLLDTDVMIDVLRRFPDAVAWLAVQSIEEVVLPGFVVLELLQGCLDKADQDRVERLVAGGRVVWPTESACNAGVQTYAQFQLVTIWASLMP
jgi:predicted nucleic acid-binding protein